MHNPNAHKTSVVMMRTPTAFFLLLSALLNLSAYAFQQQQPRINLPRSVIQSTSSILTQQQQHVLASHSSSLLPSPHLLAAHFANSDEGEITATTSFPLMLRNRLRKVTGFSFTVFRATLRGITGISLTALYAGCFAATGLWIRKTMSVLLSVFPSGFRYFLQPFLVMYYTPLILIKSLTSPINQKRAAAKHETVLEAWKEAVAVAEKAEKEGYRPVVVNDEGYFELAKPPTVDGVLMTSNDDSGSATEMAEAMAATIEQAMELKSESSNDEK